MASPTPEKAEPGSETIAPHKEASADGQHSEISETTSYRSAPEPAQILTQHAIQQTITRVNREAQGHQTDTGRTPSCEHQSLDGGPSQVFHSSSASGICPPSTTSIPSVHGSSSNESNIIRDVRCDVLTHWLHMKQIERVWTDRSPGEGVLVKRSKGHYAYAPPELILDGSNLYDAVAQLNVKCAMTINSRIINYVLERNETPFVQIQTHLRVQVVADFEGLPFCQRGQSAAFIADRKLLVVWHEDPKALIQLGQKIQDALAETLCGDELGSGSTKNSSEDSPFSSMVEYEEEDEKAEESSSDKPRKIMLWQSAYTSIAVFLSIISIGFGWSKVAIEQVQEPNWLRLLFLLCLPGQFWLAQFFFQALIGNIGQVFGRTNGVMQQNSKYYSAKAPRRLRPETNGGTLPHMTIQIPVYKEGLKSVIAPTIQSVKEAISRYEMQGGTANIFINDDGMQIIPHHEAAERQDYYDENGIGWVARPKHNPTSEPGRKGFLRRGKFKKASNMNYGLRLSVRVEDILAHTQRTDNWTQIQENAAYKFALDLAIAEKEGEAWADGSIRMGDYILLVDSDTRVPKDCLLEAASEMEQSPQVAILQYSSGVMNVTNNFFECGITYFTNMIYTMIRFTVANGDVAPFVGHNAILRWSALQEVAYHCPDDGWEKYWSENTVSEDFDMALRLQTQGYVIRFGAYKKDGYKEGVSLTVYDELARWEKYAYGCNELIFNPLKDWILKGPFTKLFRTFVFSNMPLCSKITIMAYIGTYYAIGSAWLLTLLNYFLIGFYNGWLDHYYVPSFTIWFSIVIVFSGFGNISLAVMRHRLKEMDFLKALWLNVKWIPLVTIFLGGISLHVSQALLCHFFSIDMQWGATSKEAEDVSFFDAMKQVLKRFKWCFLFCFATASAMVACRFALPEDWQITEFVAIIPLSLVVVTHFLLPIVLNPQLMRFSW